MPSTYYPWAVFYRKSVFAQKGYQVPKTLDQFKALEPTFRDIQAYFKSLRAPKYPFPIDQPRADRGRTLFASTCAKCHGTYGENETYPNLIIDLKKIGTDPARANGLTDAFVAPPSTRPIRNRSATRPRRSTASGRPPLISTTAPCRPSPPS